MRGNSNPCLLEKESHYTWTEAENPGPCLSREQAFWGHGPVQHKMGLLASRAVSCSTRVKQAMLSTPPAARWLHCGELTGLKALNKHHDALLKGPCGNQRAREATVTTWEVWPSPTLGSTGMEEIWMKADTLTAPSGCAPEASAGYRGGKALPLPLGCYHPQLR